MKGEIIFKDLDAAFNCAEILLGEEYAVMLSYEDNWIVLNYIWDQDWCPSRECSFIDRCEHDDGRACTE